MYFYKAMSDISRFIPTAGLQNIAEAGANRLAAAQSAESRELSSQGLARSIEAGLGGMKMTTFGGKVFSGIEKEGGAYLKQQVGRLQSAAKDSAGNAWESATSALRARDPVAPTPNGRNRKCRSGRFSADRTSSSRSTSNRSSTSSSRR